MSLKHQKRIDGVVDAALKAAAMGEPYGFFATFTFGPELGPDMQPVLDKPYIPGWFVAVSIRNSNPDETDLMTGFFIPGVMPTDDEFRFIANGLLANVRNARDQKQGDELAQARAAFRQQMQGAAA